MSSFDIGHGSQVSSSHKLLSGKQKEPPEDKYDRATFIRLAAVFGALYFVQGIADPNWGLVAQPVRKMLKDWGYGVDQISTLVSILTLPWSLEPFFGPLTDSVPIFGSRRRSWLIITASMVCIGLGALYFKQPSVGEEAYLRGMLLLPTVGVAFGNVITDALMVTQAQPLRCTGALKSVQWGCCKLAKIITAILGGWLASQGQAGFDTSFLICSASALVPFFLALCVIQEPPARPHITVRFVAQEIRAAVQSRTLQLLALFACLINCNPFNPTLLYLYTTASLHITEQDYGIAQSIRAAAGVLFAALYSLYSPRLSTRSLLYLSMATNVAASLLFLGVRDSKSLMALNFLGGAATTSSYLVLVDLMARVIPADVAGTVFACMMSLLNLTWTSFTFLGGKFYASLLVRYPAPVAFTILVGAGPLIPVLCTLLIPWLDKELSRHPMIAENCPPDLPGEEHNAQKVDEEEEHDGEEDKPSIVLLQPVVDHTDQQGRDGPAQPVPGKQHKYPAGPFDETLTEPLL